MTTDREHEQPQPDASAVLVCARERLGSTAPSGPLMRQRERRGFAAAITRAEFRAFWSYKSPFWTWQA
jgi:hypothetical protein